jgi:hypothetical protein
VISSVVTNDLVSLKRSRELLALQISYKNPKIRTKETFFLSYQGHKTCNVHVLHSLCKTYQEFTIVKWWFKDTHINKENLKNQELIWLNLHL